MATLSVLVSGLETELRRLGYKDSTLDIVTDELPEWNRDAGLLDWLAGL